MAANNFDSFLRALEPNNFSLNGKQLVWQKASTVAGYSPAHVRQDVCGAYIEWNQYGNISSAYGWEIDHIHPSFRGGSSSLSNLQPLHWRNNRAKGDSSTMYSCAVRSAIV